MRKLVYYVASSLDGFIAAPDGDTSAFPVSPDLLAAVFTRLPETCPHHLRAALGVSGEPKRFDTVLMGYRTHAPALESGLASAYPHLRQIVVTHRDLPADSTVEAWSGDLADRIEALKSEPGDDIWLCGGGDLAGQLSDHIDELQIKLNPVTLGKGIPLFSGSCQQSWVGTGVEPLPGDVTLLSFNAASS